MAGQQRKRRTKTDAIVDRIPNEILEAFSQDSGFSLLIKGAAGTGKTTMALELLSIFEPAIYLSTRVAPMSLFQQFPWIQDKIQPENILDATRTFLPPYHETYALKTHIKQTLRFASVPDFLKILYEKVDQYGSPIIVIDSWDAVVGSQNQEREKNETLLTEFVRQMKVRLILISESVGQSFLDYIVDGIVTLRDQQVEGRVIRSIELNKMRGIEREQKKYVLTLYNNHFQFVKSLAPAHPKKIKPWVVEKDSEEMFSTGNRDLNLLYGQGLRPGTFNLLEIGYNVPISAYSPLLLSMVCNFLSQDRGVILQTMEGINSELIDKKRLFLYEEVEKINQFLRILMEKVSDRDDIRPYIIQIKDENKQQRFLEIYEELSSYTRFQPVFVGITYDTLSFYSNFKSVLSSFYDHLRLIKNLNVIELGVINSMEIPPGTGTERATMPASLNQDLSYVSDTHLKIISIDGATMIYGVKPRTGLFAINYDISQGMPKLQLTPVV